ncbi:hypothetical protein clem_12920 [Legionella clemsonensis]|uniref:Uncharacterized protein n=1 Tax=Legionella clemsonensis TaxID=1867846 RepID=A0A222P5M6_9GAMM|nr:hypothetical protein clem_12920 [Legionella clemsonensis]
MLILSLSHILAYAPSLSHQHASIKVKFLAKIFAAFVFYYLQKFANLISDNNFVDCTSFLLLKTNCVGTSGELSCFKIKEVIQPQVPLRLPCYDFTPVMNHTVVNVPPKVRLSTSGATHSHGVTGGVYKARERIHRDMLIRDY